MKETIDYLYNFLISAGPFLMGILLASIFIRMSKLRIFILACWELSRQHDIENIMYYTATRNPMARQWFLMSMPSYARMLFSFKKLEPENYFTKEQWDRIWDFNLKVPNNFSKPITLPPDVPPANNFIR